MSMESMISPANQKEKKPVAFLLEKVKNYRKAIGLSVLMLLAGGKEAIGQHNPELLNRYKENIEQKKSLDINNLSPDEIYKNFGGEENLKIFTPEEYGQMRENFEDKPAILSPFIEKKKQIEKDAGFEESPEMMDPLPGETEEEYKKRYIETRKIYQEKIGKELEDFSNKYLKGKRQYYRKSLRNIKNFEGGYITDQDLFINSFLNFHYDKNEKQDYKEHLKNSLENMQYKWDKYDYTKTDEELKEMAEEVWMFNKDDNEEKESGETPPPDLKVES